MNTRVVLEAPNALIPTAAGCLGFLIFLSYVFSSFSKSSKQRKFPPGPKPKPLIGNLLDMPPRGSKVEEYWTKHREEYGPISSLDVFGQKFYVINDANIAYELLEKRSSNYSQRPVMSMGGAMTGWDQGIVLTQPGDRFREMRKVAHNQVGSRSTVSRWKTQIDTEVRRYLLRTLEQPNKFLDHIRKEAGTIILMITYGYNANPHGEDRLVDLAQQCMEDFGKAAAPGEWMVDLLPFLQYIPEWVPGADFKRIGREYSERLKKLRQLPYSFTKKQIVDGVAPISIVSQTLPKLDSSTTHDDDIVSWAAVSMYAGGADTTVAQMEMLYLAMELYPDVLRKAQEEIDSVIGDERLPEEDDRDRLPYVDALFKELIRWEPIGGVVIPHVAAEDDTYDGYFIPKGTMMLGHIYGWYHDPDVYHDPMEFKPERFLGENPEPNPFDTIWGYGKRRCPGRHLAIWNLWLQISRTIAVFDIKPFNGIPPERDFTTGVVRRPLNLKADIKVRSPQHERLIRSVEEEAPMPVEGDSVF